MWLRRVQEASKSNNRHTRKKQRPIKPFTGPYGFELGSRRNFAAVSPSSDFGTSVKEGAVSNFAKSDGEDISLRAEDVADMIRTPQVPLWAATSMRVTPAEMPGYS